MSLQGPMYARCGRCKHIYKYNPDAGIGLHCPLCRNSDSPEELLPANGETMIKILFNKRLFSEVLFKKDKKE